MNRPNPNPVPWDKPFWEHGQRGELHLQRCRDCTAFQHYPRPVCGECGSLELEFVASRGAGVLYSFAIVRRPEHSAFQDEAPYTLVDVDLDEGVRIVARLVDETESASLMIGDTVVAEMLPVGDGTYRLPFFRRRNP